MRYLICKNTKAGRKADEEHYKRCMEQEGIPYLAIRVRGRYADIILDVIADLTEEEKAALYNAAEPYFLSGAAHSFSISPDLCAVNRIRIKDGMKLVEEWADILAARYEEPLPIQEQLKMRLLSLARSAAGEE